MGAKKREARLLKIIDSLAASVADIDLLLQETVAVLNNRITALTDSIRLSNTKGFQRATAAASPEVSQKKAPIESKGIDTHALFDLSEPRSDVAPDVLPGDNYCTHKSVSKGDEFNPDRCNNCLQAVYERSDYKL